MAYDDSMPAEVRTREWYLANHNKQTGAVKFFQLLDYWQPHNFVIDIAHTTKGMINTCYSMTNINLYRYYGPHFKGIFH